MQGSADPNAPITNLDDFFGGGITLAQYERKDDPLTQEAQREATPMNVDLIDMNAFIGDDPQEDTRFETTTASSSVLQTDFLAEDEIGLRDHSESQILTPIANPYNNEEKPKINLVRTDESTEFIQSSRVWRCLSCLKLGDFSKYFDVNSKEVATRLKYTIYGHFIGMERPSFAKEQSYHGVGNLSQQDQVEKPDFDLYAPIWILVTLVVECPIVSYLNRCVQAGMSSSEDLENVQFSMLTLCNLSFFLAFFFSAPPFAIYIFARLKLLDGSTKFWRLFAALGYSYATFIPAVLLTIVGIGFLQWLFLGLACANQLFGLYKQADQLVPIQASESGSNRQSSDTGLSAEEREKLVRVMRISLLVSQLLFAFCLKEFFIE